MKKDIGLTDLEYDALRECGNVGIGNAVTSLAKMTGKKIEINIPETRFTPLHEFSREIGGPEKIVWGIYLEIIGDVKGETLFIFPIECAKELANLLMGRPTEAECSMDEMDVSSLMEMSNIFVGSYLNALSAMVDLKILPSLPYAATDMVQAVVDLAMIKVGTYADEILMVKEKIRFEDHNIDGTFIILFEDDSLKRMIQKIHEKYGLSN